MPCQTDNTDPRSDASLNKTSSTKCGTLLQDALFKEASQTTWALAICLVSPSELVDKSLLLQTHPIFGFELYRNQLRTGLEDSILLYYLLSWYQMMLIWLLFCRGSDGLTQQ